MGCHLQPERLNKNAHPSPKDGVDRGTTFISRTGALHDPLIANSYSNWLPG
ncbi:hypothetical protein JR338_07750 [Chloroflexota bacterium]|nr:hypothetical protein JR338_07750 [Chloroflexota bacterium]